MSQLTRNHMQKFNKSKYLSKNAIVEINFETILKVSY